MSYSISLNNFKKVAAVATFLTTSACLVPKPAQAGFAKGSGESGNLTNFTFDLNLDQTKNKEGFFPDAIRNFKAFSKFGGTPITKNVDICPNYKNEPCPFGDVRVTPIPNVTDFSSYVPDLKLGYGDNKKQVSWQQLQDVINGGTGNNLYDFSKSGLRYDFTFSENIDEPDMIWFIQSNDYKLINDLSGLINFQFILGIFPRKVQFSKNTNSFEHSSKFRFDLVPEPVPTSIPESTATSSLLGIGALGVVSLLKRNKRLKKSV